MTDFLALGRGELMVDLNLFFDLLNQQPWEVRIPIYGGTVVALFAAFVSFLALCEWALSPIGLRIRTPVARGVRRSVERAEAPVSRQGESARLFDLAFERQRRAQ